MLKRLFGLYTKQDVMNLLKAKGETAPEYARMTADKDHWNMPDYSVFQAQASLYNRVTAVRTAVNLVPQVAAAGGFRVMDGEDDDAQEVAKHPFMKVWNRPNPWSSRRSFIRDVISFYMLTANSYIWINSATPESEPDELWVIPSSQVVPVPDGNQYILGYEYNVGDGRLLLLSPKEVLHIRGFNPLNMFYGSSNALPVALTAEADQAAQRWNAKFFNGNARLPGVLSFSDFIDDKPWGDIERTITTQAEKRNMLLLRGTGTGGVNYMNTGGTARDMEFSTLRDQAWEEILAVYAPGLVSMLSPNATEANARTGKATLIDLVAQPLRDMLADEVNNKIMPRYVDGAVFVADDIRISDQVLRLQEIQEYSKTHTVDEVRAKYWDDDGIGGDAGELIVAAAQSYQQPAQEPTSEPMQTESEQTVMPIEIGNGAQSDFDAMTPQISKALVELDKWQAKSEKAGTLVTWHAVHIPPAVVTAVKSGKSWDEAREMLQNKPSDIKTLAASINALADAMRKA